MCDEDQNGTFTIKCALGRLRPSLQLRAAIENTVEMMHSIALRGSYVATEAWLASGDAPPVVNQTWWFRCFASTYTTRRKPSDVGDAAIASLRLAPNSARICLPCKGTTSGGLRPSTPEMP